MPKILFISHDAYRAGAQLLLLQYLNWISQNEENIEFKLLLVRGGELEIEFKKISSVYIWEKTFHKNNFIKRMSVKWYHQSIKRKIRRENFDLIYANTITNGNILKEIGLKNIPVITHVHEMNYWIKKAGVENLINTKLYTTQFIAASSSVKNLLMDQYNIDSDKVEVIYEFTNTLEGEKKQSIKNHLGLAEDVIIVGGCGGENWRKGKDLFLLIAINTLYKSQNSKLHFVWIGGELNPELEYDLQQSGFVSQIHFINHLSNAACYFYEFSVFCMTSREDPFPVVNLEAGLRGVPVICFENTGGTVELIQNFKDLVIPYGNIKMMSERIIELINDDKLRKIIGDQLKEKIESEFLLNNIARQLMAIVKQVIPTNN